MNPQQDQWLKYIPVGIAVTAALSIIFFALAIFGYGTIKITVGDASKVTINGHDYSKNSAIKVHPGTYTVSVSGARYSMQDYHISVKAFGTTVVSSTNFPKRDPVDIVRSVIGTNSAYGAPTVNNARWFGSTWMGAVVGPGAASTIVVHYAGDTWQAVYFEDSGYVGVTDGLPADAVTFIREIQQAEQ